MNPTSYFAQAPLALVVGCGDLGMACARHLGLRHPLLIIDIDSARLDQEVSTLQRQGYAVFGQTCDIADIEQTKALGKRLKQSAGVKVLAHVAAVGPTIGDWRKMMMINLVGPHLVVHAVRPHLMRGSAAIFVSSGGGYFVSASEPRDGVLDDPLAPDFFQRFVDVLGGDPDLHKTYCYSKRALTRFAKKLAVEWGPAEIRSLSISPGAIETSMASKDGALAAGRADIVRAIPLAREGTINEVAAVLAFLASDAARFVNGVDLLIDGGASAALTLSKSEK